LIQHNNLSKAKNATPNFSWLNDNFEIGETAPPKKKKFSATPENNYELHADFFVREFVSLPGTVCLVEKHNSCEFENGRWYRLAAIDVVFVVV